MMDKNDLSEEDLKFLKAMGKCKGPNSMDQIRQAQRLRDDHRLCEYVFIAGCAGWWTLTDEGRRITA